MKSKAVQYFSDDYLKQSRNLQAEQILSFLEDFRLLHGSIDNDDKPKPIKNSPIPALNFSKVKKIKRI